MNCREARNWISPYLDSELGKTKTFEVSEHLRRCPECAKRFSQEHKVDDGMRSRLVPPTMPLAQWSGFRGKLTPTPWPSWVRLLNGRRGLALAACLVIATIASVVGFQARDKQANMPAIVNRFLVEVPNDQPFAVVQPGQRSLDTVLRSEFGLRFASAADVDARGHWDFQLVSAVRRTDDTGRAYLDVRLNCCGQPVLLTLARPVDGNLPAPFDGIEPGRAGGSRTPHEGLRFAYATVGDVHVVAVARHAVQHVIDSISLVAT